MSIATETGFDFLTKLFYSFNKVDDEGKTLAFQKQRFPTTFVIDTFVDI